MADALLSTPVAVVTDVVAAALVVVAGRKVAKSPRENLVALMGVLGACVFAAQMVNFSIPGTGSSGHIIGGVFLAALIGPWAAFLTLTSVLIVQCLVFADGGLLALGCNILNMAAMSCLVAYPLIFRPLMKFPASAGRLLSVSALTCIVGLECGACLVTAETKLSGITALSTGNFFALMTSIHLAIGLCEGLATGAILWFVQRARPDLLTQDPVERKSGRKLWPVLAGFAGAALAIGGVLSFFASSDPDGLEWSIQKVTGATELPTHDALAAASEGVQASTAAMPGYENSLSGIVGTLIVLFTLWLVCTLIRAGRRRHAVKVKS